MLIAKIITGVVLKLYCGALNVYIPQGFIVGYKQT